MTGKQVADLLENNFSEVSAEIDSTKTMVAAEEERAKGVEKGLTQAVAQNTVAINGLKEYAATKTELKAEADRANNAEKNIATMVQQNAREIKILGEEIDEMKEKVVYLSQSEYDQLVQSGGIKEDVEYNVYEDV